ncbi:MAG: serine hydrolase domain-containing protein [Candidatus Eiseniibacteriota bacterium]
MRFVRLIGLAAALGALMAPACAAAAPPRHPLDSKVDAYLQPLRDLEVFDGVVVVARHDSVLARRAYGLANQELRVPNAPERRFRIASISKLFTAAAIGRLSEQGALELGTPLSRFLPDFPNADSITIEMLLHHRAGVPNVNELPIEEDGSHDNSLDDLIAHLSHLPPAFSPGARTEYSNGGYAVLAAVIERASGKRYSRFVHDEILAPLGLRDTGEEADRMLVENRAYGYQPDPAGDRGLIPGAYQQMATKTGGGSLVSTADDLRRFAAAMFRDNVIHRSTWEAVIPTTDGTLTAMGRCPGYNSLLSLRLADRLTIVVLSNNYAAGMLAEVGRALARIADGSTVAPARYERVNVSLAALATRAGRFAIPDGALPFLEDRVIKIQMEGDHLVAYSRDTPLDALIPESEHIFLLRNLWSELTFGDSSSQVILRPLYRPGSITLEREVAR